MTRSWSGALGVGLIVMAAQGARAEQPIHWPQWRGPQVNGISKATNLPTRWSETENIAWKVPLPSWSAATAIIWGDRIFVTSPSAAKAGSKVEGRALGRRSPRHQGGEALLLICLNKRDGAELWRRELGTGNRTYARQNMTSPSPVTDGKHLWVMTGTGVLTCFDMDGKQIWQQNIEEQYGKFGLNWGYASSPLLLSDKVVVEVLHGMHTDEPSYLLAVDKLTGKRIWRVDRWTDAPHESPDAYTTPTILNYKDRFEIVVSGGDYVTGHDPATGKETWRVKGLNPNGVGNFRIIGSPVAYDGIVYAPTRRRPLLAIRGGGRGTVTDTHTLFRSPRGPDVPTPVCDGTYLYILDDRGRMVCLDAKTGESRWPDEARIDQGTYSASMLLADGKLYATNHSGTTTVMAAGPEFKVLATNDLDDEWVLASFAVSEGRLYLRGETHLYCIGK